MSGNASLKFLTGYELDNQPPEFNRDAASVAENLPAFTVVFTARATDGSAVTYSLEGTDRSLLSIDATSGEVRLNSPANFEVKSSYIFTVRASDEVGNTSSRDVTLGVTDVNEAVVLAAGAKANVTLVTSTGADIKPIILSSQFRKFKTPSRKK